MVNHSVNLDKIAERVEAYRSLIESDPYRCHFHLMPPVGFLNDPNGLVEFKGRYHVFYQWNPFKTEHGAKFWGHYSTEDFINWTMEPVALSPGDWYDANGCYSGSALEHDGKLYLFYTGNVKNAEGERQSYQCMAVSEDGIHFDKKGPVIYLPAGYTSHFRDPKVWEHDGKWYMVIGAQSEQLEGRVVLYSSMDLEKWQFLGPIAGSRMNDLGELGYMWECPDLFQLNGVDVLLSSPQGVMQKEDEYNNEFQSLCFIGELDCEAVVYKHQSMKELDRGFDFYAPQTMKDRFGRRIMIAWLGMSDKYEPFQPTVNNEWLHMLTLPRELSIIQDKLYQTPLRELQNLRAAKLEDAVITIGRENPYHRETGNLSSAEIMLSAEHEILGSFEIVLRNHIRLHYDSRLERFTLSRANVKDGKREYRHCHLKQLKTVHIFADSSAVEVFLNHGEEVFTARFYSDPEAGGLILLHDNTTTVSLQIWELRPFNYITGAAHPVKS